MFQFLSGCCSQRSPNPTRPVGPAHPVIPHDNKVNNRNLLGLAGHPSHERATKEEAIQAALQRWERYVQFAILNPGYESEKVRRYMITMAKLCVMGTVPGMTRRDIPDPYKEAWELSQFERTSSTSVSRSGALVAAGVCAIMNGRDAFLADGRLNTNFFYADLLNTVKSTAKGGDGACTEEVLRRAIPLRYLAGVELLDVQDVKQGYMPRVRLKEGLIVKLPILGKTDVPHEPVSSMPLFATPGIVISENLFYSRRSGNPPPYFPSNEATPGTATPVIPSYDDLFMPTP